MKRFVYLIIEVLMIFIVIAYFLSTICGCSKNLFGFNSLDFNKGKSDMEEVRLNLHSIEDVEILMSRFKYQDVNQTVDPCVEYVFANNLHGDCRWATVLCMWACEQVGMETMYVDLIDHSGEDHSICVAWYEVNEWYYFTPYNLFGIIYSNDWRQAVLESYNGMFEEVRIRKQPMMLHDQGGIE